MIERTHVTHLACMTGEDLAIWCDIQRRLGAAWVWQSFAMDAHDAHELFYLVDSAHDRRSAAGGVKNGRLLRIERDE